MKTIEDTSIRICSISDDEEESNIIETGAPSSNSAAYSTVVAAVATNNRNNLATVDNAYEDIDDVDATSSDIGTTFNNQASRKNVQQQQLLQLQDQEQRPSKLLRTRAPVNQPKPKDSDTLLMETSLMIINPSPILPSVHLYTSAAAATTTTTQPPPPPPSSSSTSSKPLVQLIDANDADSSLSSQPTILPLVQRTQQQQHQNHHQYQTTSTSSHRTATEPEIVLSPAKLGQ